MATVPTMTGTDRYLVALDQPGCNDPGQVGTKAATLAVLARAGFHVPDGVVLTTAAFDDATARTAGVDGSAAPTAVPVEVERALLRVAARFGDVDVAVRSSGVAEDLADASYAGQYETVLGVRGPGALVEAVQRCWGSAASTRVRTYRDEHDAGGPAPLAVLVQRQLAPAAAGVAFTADPVTGDRSTVLIDAVAGLGDRMVSGEVTPEQWRIGPGGAHRVALDGGVLTAAQAEAVAQLARDVEANAGAPQDIEWALDDDGLWLLQARPITGLPTITPVPVPVEVPDGYWERDAGHAPAPVSPLQRSLTYPSANRHTPRIFARFGMLAERIELRDIGGWHYYRVVPIGGKDRPPPPLPVAWLAARLHPQVRRRIRAAIAASRSDLAGATIEQWYGDWLPELEERIDALKAVDLGALDDRDLAHHLEAVAGLTDDGIRVHTTVIGVQLVELYGLAKACGELLDWDDARAFELLQGLSHRSTTPARRLAELARLVAERPALRELVEGREGLDDDAVEEILAADRPFADAFAAYLRDHGHQGLSRDVVDPIAAERPALLLQLIANQLATGFDPAVTDDHAATRRSATLDEARRRLADRPEADRDRFEDALRRAERAYPIREDNVATTLFGPFGLVRLAALEVGRRMAGRDQLAEPQDVFQLEYDELRAALRDRTDQRALVDRRKGERAWVEAHPGPACYGTKPEPPASLDFLPRPARFAMEALLWTTTPGLMWATGDPQANTATRVQGTAASPGRHTGTVRVVRSEAEFDRLRAGDVLVCPVTSPTWSVLFPSVGAVVTDSGGVLSHPAIIAREYQVPAVVGTGNATDVLRDGEVVTVDGTTGVVVAGAPDGTEADEDVAPVPIDTEPPPGFWVREVSHAPQPHTAFNRIFVELQVRSARRLGERFGMLFEGVDFREIGGYQYIRMVPLGGKDRPPPPARLLPLLARLVPAMRRQAKLAEQVLREDRASQLIARWHDDWRPGLVADLARLRAVDRGALDDAGLDAHLADALEAYFRLGDVKMDLHVAADMLTLSELAATCRELLGWDDAEALDLVVGLSPSSTAPVSDLDELAALVADRPAVRDLLLAGADLDAVTAADGTVAAAFDDYVDRHGHRTLRYEVAEPTFAERPDLLLGVLRGRVAAGAGADDDVDRRRRGAVARARDALADRPAPDRDRFEDVLRRAERAYPVREDSGTVGFEVFAAVRDAALEVGRRLAARDQIAARDDVFHLEAHEARAALRDGRPRHDLVRRRRGERRWAATHPGPASFGRDPGPPPPLDGLQDGLRRVTEGMLWGIGHIAELERSGASQDDDRSLVGVAASPGRRTGTVRVIRDESEFGKLEAGDVVVCPITSPSWSVLFPSMGAVVTDTGGILSHPAIIAREYGIPAVVATGNATELLRDGQTVTVDGGAGTVGVVPAPA